MTARTNKVFVLAVAYSNHEYKLICAYVDRQHKYVAFVLAVGNNDHQHTKNEVPAQKFFVLV